MRPDGEKSAICTLKSEISNRLIIFTRYPEPGKTKTRLISALGPEGAADLQRQMTEFTVSWARRPQIDSFASLEIRYEGGSETLMRQWLGSGISLCPQGNGDLGARMARAFGEAFAAGVKRVIIVGTDCPGITEHPVEEAFRELEDFDVVLGPATDGGYYLIGLRANISHLFADIPWGTDEVLQKTLQVANRLKLQVFILGPLRDVDRPEDLPAWEKFAITPSRLEGKGGGDLPLISIIIPTLNEEGNIARCLASTGDDPNIERIVVDGGSRDRTVEIARSCGAQVLFSPAGRARQMNTGARQAKGDLLVFLHADTVLPSGFADGVRQTLAQPEVAAGAFEFRLDATSGGLRIIERVANWRSRRWQIPYGDQAIFIRSALFHEMSGFPDIPIMEDFEFIRRLKKRGRIITVAKPAITSARRWHMMGVWQATLSNWLIILAYYLGIPLSNIIRWARRER